MIFDVQPRPTRGGVDFDWLTFLPVCVAILAITAALYLWARRREQEALEHWARVLDVPRIEGETEDSWRERVMQRASVWARGGVLR